MVRGILNHWARSQSKKFSVALESRIVTQKDTVDTEVDDVYCNRAAVF